MDERTFFALMELFRTALKIANFDLCLRGGFSSHDASIDVQEVDFVFTDIDVIENVQDLLGELLERLSDEKD